MKKALSVFLITIMLVASLSACASDTEEATQGTTQLTFTQAITESQIPTTNDTTNTQNNTNNNNNNTENDDQKESQNANATTDEAKFEAACKLITNGKIEEAYSALKELTNYAPAKEKLKNFVYAPTTVKDVQYDRTETFEYNAYGDIVSITNINGVNLSLTYDANGNVLTGYNISHSTSTDLCIYSYKNGKLSSYTYGNDLKYTYEYNDKGYVSKIITENGYYDSTEETVYTYTYYDNGAVKTVTIPDVHDSTFETYEYNEKGQFTKIVLYEGDNEAEKVHFADIIITYGEHGISKAEFCYSEAICDEYGFDKNEPYGVYEYTYDKDGKLVDFRLTTPEGISEIYSFTSHKLCYVENASTLERISTVSMTTPEEIINFFD